MNEAERTVLKETPPATPTSPVLEIRPARVSDVPEIKRLIDANVQEGVLLPKPLFVLYETVRDFKVCVDEEKVVGVGALHVVWEDLAEVRSIAVAPTHQRKGIGRRLVTELLEEARKLDVGRVFALTYATDFFFSLGFRVIDKTQLPHKIWADCIQCHKFPICDEVAVIREFKSYPEGSMGPPPGLPQVVDLGRLVPGVEPV